MVSNILVSDLISHLIESSDSAYIPVLKRFFKTGRGDYAEYDVFLGIKVPRLRKIIRSYLELSLQDLEVLLSSKFHEVRFAGALLLVEKYSNKDVLAGETIVNFYLDNASKFNNWDLVDLTAPKILGDYLLTRKKDLLYKLIINEDKWVRRIAMVSTLTLIKNNDLNDVFNLAKILMKDDFDLSHKASGWMLREAGKKDVGRLKQFLDENKIWMPRTSLRYAIELFSEVERKRYLSICNLE